ncbi:MAG: methylenetetrahydrofolate reductase [NAD(P)H] [Christensenellaceae bacterium]|jgi:methylenetetrahydrofolate reductase (NADPH)|nr:methylenetetrahydrofolate reductase [NAD(P)H] [Christensenellaceae bacterium]
MKIASLFGPGRAVFSFEVFPPKKNGGDIASIYGTLDALQPLKPDFISVTYGAGGLEAGNSLSCEIAAAIKNRYSIESAAHLTCVNSTRAQVDAELHSLQEAGIENVLALRGDILPDLPRRHDFAYASELVAYIHQHSEMGISGACYPEGHVESESSVEDVLNLKKKVDAGVSHLVSQLFFDNSFFYAFVEKARIAGIHVPIEAGIMPVVNKKQIERMVSMCGASLPRKFVKIMQRYENNPEALRDAGIAYAVNQIVDLLTNGVEGIHLYTMNNPYVARRIHESVHNLLAR